MAFSPSLAARIRDAVARHRNIQEKKMFGGVGFLLDGNLLVGVWKNSLIVRLGLNAYQSATRQPHVREFDVTGRPMKGWVMVEPEGVEDDSQLRHWVERALDFVSTLPKKPKRLK